MISLAIGPNVPASVPLAGRLRRLELERQLGDSQAGANSSGTQRELDVDVVGDVSVVVETPRQSHSGDPPASLTCVVATLPIATEPDQEIENVLGPPQELGSLMGPT